MTFILNTQTIFMMNMENKFINFLKKLVTIFKTKKYGNVFSEVNQPCFDKNGNFLGWFSRSMATSLFLFCRDKHGMVHVLASERGKGTPDFQGYWNCTCGYLDFNETTKQGALRELREETGVIIDEDQLRFIGYEDSPTANHQNVTFRFGAYIADKTIDDFVFSKKDNEKNEVGRIAWIPLNERDKYDWAFGHKARIVEISHELGLI